MSLDQLVRAARLEGPRWDEARGVRVLAKTLATNTKRTVRARLVRRSLVALSTVGVLVLVMLRAAASTTDAGDLRQGHDTLAASQPSVDRSDDGGYSRD